MLAVALRLRCPACGKGRLYAGLLQVAEKCEHCGFALKEHDSGDGPVFFAMLFVGVLALLLAVVLEWVFQPPVWVHGLVAAPLIIGGTVFFLRIVKSVLISLQYAHKVHGYGDKGH